MAKLTSCCRCLSPFPKSSSVCSFISDFVLENNRIQKIQGEESWEFCQGHRLLHEIPVSKIKLQIFPLSDKENSAWGELEREKATWSLITHQIKQSNRAIEKGTGKMTCLQKGKPCPEREEKPQSTQQVWEREDDFKQLREKEKAF